MNKKKIISTILSASMLMSVGMISPASAAGEHQAGAHDFGDPFALYVNTKLVLKDTITAPSTISHTSRNVNGSPSVTADIIESSAQFYTRDNGDGSLSDGSLESREYGNVKNIMFAYMYEPATDGKYPAILFLHGGGGTADTMKERAQDFAAKGYVTMAIDIPALTGTVGNVTVNGAAEARSSGKYIGNDNYRFNITEAEGGAKNSNLVDAEVGVLQAFNYLAANSKVDASNMGIMGSSWGGYSTTFVTGILGDKVKAAYSQYGSGFYGPTADGTKYESFWTENGYYPTDTFAIEEWYSYLDPSSHLDTMTANYYMDAAAKDTFFRPKSVEATLNKAQGHAKTANHVWSYNASHESISGSDSVYTFMDYYLKGIGTAPSETEITKTELLADGSNKVSIKVTADAEPTSVKLVYSKNNAAYTAREWKTMDASADGNGEYTVTLPADVVAGGVEYYALTRDSDKAMYSSSMMKTGFTQKVSLTGTPTFTIGDSKVYKLGKGEFTAKVPVVNNDESEPSDVRVILALYKNGAAEKITFSDTAELKAGEQAEIPVSAEISADDVSDYTAKVFVWDGTGGMKPYSKAFSLASTDSAPTVPGNFRAVSSTFDGISLVWGASEDNIAVEGYNVYRKASGESDYTKLASLAGNVLTYTDSMIELNKAYDYAVTAFDAGDNESGKATVSANSIEGAKVVFDSLDSNNSVEGDKMTAKVVTKEGSPVSIEENHNPLQDEVMANCLKVQNDAGGTYIQLSVDDAYINSELDHKVAVMVTFDDVNFDNIRMQYNSTDGQADKPAVIYKKLNEQRWMTKTYIIEDAAFANRSGFDLRVNFDKETTNYIRMIQIVNLSQAFDSISSGADSITLAWTCVSGAAAYNIYRDGALVGTAAASQRTFTDEGLDFDTEYEYTLKAVVNGAENEVKTIKAATLQRYIAEYDFATGEGVNMKAAASSYDEETIDGIEAVTNENSADLTISVDNTVAKSGKDYLVTFTYNDLGSPLNMRVGMVNSSIDRAHYFSTTGTGKWETATVLVPNYTFNNNSSDLTIRATGNKKYAITNIKLSECPSYEIGGYYVNGIVSGVTVNDDMLNTTMTSLRTENDKTSIEVTETDGLKSIKLNTTDVTANGKRAAINIVPDYRFLGQTYGGAVLPGAEGYDTKPAAVRPVTVKVTYYANNTKGMLYVKGAKYDEAKNSIEYPNNDAEISLTGGGEWKAAKVNIDDYYVRGTSDSVYSKIQLIASGVPEDEDIIIGKIEVTQRDYSTKVGEYSFADAENAQALTMSCDDGVDIKTVAGKEAAYIEIPNESLRFAVDKDAVSGRRDRLLTITYNDLGSKDTPVRVSMVNDEIDGAHYFYTRGTNTWETTTVLIPNANFSGNPNDITIRLINDDKTIAISKVELYDGGEHTDRTENTGAFGATGINSGLTAYNGMFNSSLATWNPDNVTSIAYVKADGEDAIQIKPTNGGARSEFSIVPDYRYIGQTEKKVKYPAEGGDLKDGDVYPVKVRIVYKKGSGTMYVKGAELNDAQNGLVWLGDNQKVVVLGSASSNAANGVTVTNVDGDWVTAEMDIDNFYMNGGSDIYRSYILFTIGGSEDGVIVKSIDIINE